MKNPNYLNCSFYFYKLFSNNKFKKFQNYRGIKSSTSIVETTSSIKEICTHNSQIILNVNTKFNDVCENYKNFDLNTLLPTMVDETTMPTLTSLSQNSDVIFNKNKFKNLTISTIQDFKNKKQNKNMNLKTNNVDDKIIGKKSIINPIVHTKDKSLNPIIKVCGLNENTGLGNQSKLNDNDIGTTITKGVGNLSIESCDFIYESICNSPTNKSIPHGVGGCSNNFGYQSNSNNQICETFDVDFDTKIQVSIDNFTIPNNISKDNIEHYELSSDLTMDDHNEIKKPLNSKSITPTFQQSEIVAKTRTNNDVFECYMLLAHATKANEQFNEFDFDFDVTTFKNKSIVSSKPFYSGRDKIKLNKIINDIMHSS